MKPAPNLTKMEKCYPHFDITPFPTKKQVQTIARVVGCTERTAYSSWERYRALHPELYDECVIKIPRGQRITFKQHSKIYSPPLSTNYVKINPIALNPNKINIWSLSDKDLVQLFKEFVGYTDVKGIEHEGEAVPAPVDDITGDWMGIADYQAEFIIIYRDNDNIIVIWPRGHGKTWMAAWIIQFCMKYNAEKFLYFSLTDIAYTVADFVYIWAQNNRALIASETIRAAKKMSGRKSTYQKFSLINGARYEVHQIRTSSTLGYHGWNIIMDDIIDEQHKRLPHLQKSLQMKWDHQYSKIRRKKFMAINTRKFAGDFFAYLIDQFEVKGIAYKNKKGSESKKYTLHINLKTPYKGLAYAGDIEGYRKFVKRFEKNKIPYDPLDIIAPWFTSEDFEAMKLENLKSFFAEMMGNPRPLEGGNWQRDDLIFISNFEQFDYEAIYISIDPAWTISEGSNESGLTIIGLKEKLKAGRRQYTVFKAFEKKLKAKAWRDKDKKLHMGLLEFVEEQYLWVIMTFTQVRSIIIVYETNSGGQILVDIALAESDNYIHAGYIIEDKELTYSKIDKYDRIDSELFDTIKNKDMEFMDYLDEGIIINQILTFPDCLTDHCIDSLGRGKNALHKMKRQDVAKARQRSYDIVQEVKKENERVIVENFERQGIKGLRAKYPRGRVSMFRR